MIGWPRRKSKSKVRQTAVRVIVAARQFVAELENPSPDLVLRSVMRIRLQDAVNAHEEALREYARGNER